MEGERVGGKRSEKSGKNVFYIPIQTIKIGKIFKKMIVMWKYKLNNPFSSLIKINLPNVSK